MWVFFVLFPVGLASYLGQLTRQGSQHVAERCARAPLSVLCLGWQWCAGWRSPRGPPLASTALWVPRPSVCRLCALLRRRAACCVFFVFCLCSAVVVCLAAVFAVGRSAACAWVGVCACVASRRIGARASGVLWVCVGAFCCWGAGVVLLLFLFVCAGIAPFGRPGVVSCGRGGFGGVAVGVLTGVHRACVCCLRAGHAASECPAAA